MRMTTDGIVIGTHNTNECDRLITVLTEGQGVLRAFARGAKKPGSKLCGSTELLCFSRFVLFQYRDRCTVDSADGNRQFWGIRKDMDKLALASYLCELSADTSPAQAPAPEYLRLLLNSLHMLETGGRAPPFVKPVFELRQVAMAGYQPDLVGCASCGAYEGGCFYLSPMSGEVYCAACGTSGRPGVFMPVGPAVLAAMRHIIYADAPKIFSFALPEPRLRELGTVCECFVQTQLSRTFQTLAFYHTLAEGSAPPAP